MPAEFEFDEALIERSVPWPALAALEEFFAKGGQCQLSGKTNWRGIVFSCSAKADSAGVDSPEPNLLLALGWTRLAIAIREGMAREFSPEQSVGIIRSAMMDRLNMIILCGHHPGDPICDRDKVVEWCLGIPSVRQTLQLQKIPPILYVDGEARGVVQVLAALVASGRLERTGEVARLLDIIDQAKQTPRGNDLPVEV